MDAIICNAGKGTRLGPLGVHTRKCLFRDAHADKSILWYQLDALHEIGVQRAVVVIPHEDTQIPAEVARLSDRHPGMAVCCVPVMSRNVLQSIEAGLRHVQSDQVVRLDGDVCILNRRDLKCLENWAGNALCCFPPGDMLLTTSTPVVRDQGIAFWRAEDPPAPVWACIDVWRRDDLARLAESASDAESGFMFERINGLRKDSRPLEVETITIPPVYEIDTPEDLSMLHERWDAHAATLEQESLAYWRGLKEYPPFTVDKERMWDQDTLLLLEHLENGDHVVELGAGTGRLIAPLLAHAKLGRYTAVEPNPHWAESIAQSYQGDDRVQVFTGTVAEFNEVDAQEMASLAIAFGWAPYLIQDSSLHQCLKALPARRLLLKAPEPPQERFSRLRVDHYSRELGTRYISLYRSASETCQLVRSAGWVIRELRRNLYPPELESAYGSRTFLLVAERPSGP